MKHDFDNPAYIIFNTLRSALNDAYKTKQELPGTVYVMNSTIRGALKGMEALLKHPDITKDLIKDIKDELNWHEDDAKSGSSINELLNFKREGEDVPFFSEAGLYDLVGKEDARSILSHLRAVLKDHAPDRCDDI